METKRHDMGTGGSCVCSHCGYKEAHYRGVPCQQKRCPRCGAKMLRSGSYHYSLWLKKQNSRIQ